MSQNPQLRQDSGRLQPFLFLLRHSVSARPQPLEGGGERGGGNLVGRRAGNGDYGHRRLRLSGRKGTGFSRFIDVGQGRGDEDTLGIDRSQPHYRAFFIRGEVGKEFCAAVPFVFAKWLG
jgi:hypothetical protein